ncbi:unnamed protein product [Nippostrongylus brasiliensis]|uniref:DDE_3 domain-containing protein n=1 Tax=Nippostrongylus brasiliensis TaxID=27835 RepID=A0A0N4XC56_NIPBR|nr:unnamed protein product [Nippostrongylus brasiliensis]
MVSKAPRSLLHRGKIHLIMDNAGPHYAKATRDELERLGIEWLPHPAYSPDLSPCDYRAFRNLQAFCAEKTSNFPDKRTVDQWISSRSSSFWMDGIAALPVRWRKVVATDGNYCE